MLLTVDVTQENIDDSDVFSPSSCPIALALKETVKEGTYISVRGTDLIVGHDAWEFDEQIPFQLNSDHEDHGDFTTFGLEPFSFTMRIPAHHMDEYCECNECEPENDEDDDNEGEEDDNECDDDCYCHRDENDETCDHETDEDDMDQRPYTVNFLKNANGDYMIRDRDGETVILTVAQIEKLYNESRPSQSRVWASL